MKKWITGTILAAAVSVMAGSIGLPKEKIVFPEVQKGTPHLVCVWDHAGNGWLQEHVEYDHAGSYELQIPEWGDIAGDGWYWVGLWDKKAGKYVYGVWIGHFKAE